jgi:hypothetical protein
VLVLVLVLVLSLPLPLPLSAAAIGKVWTDLLLITHASWTGTLRSKPTCPSPWL